MGVSAGTNYLLLSYFAFSMAAIAKLGDNILPRPQGSNPQPGIMQGLMHLMARPAYPALGHCLAKIVFLIRSNYS